MDGTKPPTLSNASWLKDSDTRAVFAALGAAGLAARAVGGAVRNALLGLPVIDIDVATTAKPEAVMAAVQAAGLKAVPTGVAHGTVSVISGGRTVEVTTLREDVETFGRHATVAFTDDWAADARRRDFTINALYCSADGEVFDPLGGYGDLAARRVRFIGDPVARIREDYLRILRFFRLTAEYGEGAPHTESLVACVRQRDGLALLSPERVRQEMLRLLVARRGPELVAAMFDHGLITRILPAAPRTNVLARLAAVEAALARRPNGILRLAALAVAVPEDAQRLGERLRLSNEDTDRLRRTAERTPEIAPQVSESKARAYLYRHGDTAYRDRLLLAWALAAAPPDDSHWRTRLALPERWQPPRFPIGGADVKALGVPAGPRIGQVLAALEAWWIASDFTSDDAALRAKLHELVSADGAT